MISIGDKVKATEHVDKQRRAHCMGTVKSISDGWAELKTSESYRMRVRLCDIQLVKR